MVQAKAPTVTRWFLGYHPVFAVEKEPRVALSYLQVVELAFAASFRQLGVSLQRVRRAHSYLSKIFQVEYPFAQLQLQTDGVHILKELEGQGDRHIAKMVVADKDGQETWPELISARIAQFDYEFDLAMRWHPRGRANPIIIDPRISFGAPLVERAGIATWVLKERYEAGESLAEIEDDFNIERAEIDAALAFEGVAVAA